MTKAALWTGRILTGLAGAFMLFDSLIKIPPLPPVVQTMNDMAIPVSLARPIGVIELVCTVLYLIPRTAPLGAVLLTGVMGGAIATHMKLGSPLVSHTLFGVYLGVLIWAGLWLRDARVRAVLAPRP
jgi:uncharacterized membrane protein YphA (DoxX/SURF4 family)